MDSSRPLFALAPPVRSRLPIAGLLLLLAISSAQAQTPPKTEFRGAWIATVLNLDWPPRQGLTNAQYQDDLAELIAGLADGGVNAVFFQVRSECDAMYPSAQEPWSYYLGGTQGRGPLPAWDPLQHAIDEAHANGMTLHAWLNPFRCERQVGAYDLAATHPIRLHPDWMMTIENDSDKSIKMTMMDPGKPQVRSYVAGIVGDLVRRYDLDGIHFDDYFYPYPPYHIGGHDTQTFAAFGGGYASISDWRKANINRLVAEVDSSIKSIDPNVVFGISPFGIWRSGTPEGVEGLSAADAIFADATVWLADETVDYVAPQLYWPFGGGQDFAALASWWPTVAAGRHIYPGLAAHCTAAETSGGCASPYDGSQIPEQIRYTRSESGNQGHVLFRASNITRYTGSGLTDSLQAGVYRNLALLPSMAWRDLVPPDRPENFTASRSGDTVSLRWDPAIFGWVFPRYYAVYRVEAKGLLDYLAVTADARNLAAITYSPEFEDIRPPGTAPLQYVVTALSRNHAESQPSRVARVDVALASEEPPAIAALAEAPFPNPFRSELRMNVRGGGPGVTVRVHDVLGRLVREDRMMGRTTFVWDGRTPGGAPAAPGLYIISVQDGGRRVAFTAMRIN